MNARFWIYWNGGLVKITLRPGESISVHESHEEDEGWSSRSETYSHAGGDTVTREWNRSGRDCDGRHSEGGEEEVRIDRLANVFNNYVGVFYPAWEESRPTRCYDEFAQAMNY